MFCTNCGKQLMDNAKFCANCGAPVMTQQNESVGKEELVQGMESPDQEIEYSMDVKKKKFGDGAIDFLSSKLEGKKMETIRISMEDMIHLLKIHYFEQAETKEDFNKIQKAIDGGLFGNKKLDSKDGNYSFSVNVMMSLGGNVNVLQPGDSNWIRLYEKETGKVYQYNSLRWGPFKKAVKQAISEAQKKK